MAAEHKNQQRISQPIGPTPGPAHEIRVNDELILVFDGRGGATCRRQVLTRQPTIAPAKDRP